MHPAIIDLRSTEAYAIDRPQGAVRLEARDLIENAHLLPPRECPLVLIGGSGEILNTLAAALQQAGRAAVQQYPNESWRQSFLTETGPPSRAYLWQPARVVEIAVEKYKDTLPGRRALDLACGTGRNAVYLALSGFEVTAIDILPDALERTRDLAARHGVTVTTLQRDLAMPGALDDIHADLIVVVRYLERSLFPAILAALNPRGILAYETFTEAQRQLGHPRNPRYLLRSGELCRAFAGLVTLDNTIAFEDAHLERLLARRP